MANEHNKEFRRLYEAAGITKQEAAELLGVSLDTVKSWTKPESSKSACAIPKWRVDMFKLAIDQKASRIADTTRHDLFLALKALRDAGVMSEPTAKAFNRLMRAHKLATG